MRGLTVDLSRTQWPRGAFGRVGTQVPPGPLLTRRGEARSSREAHILKTAGSNPVAAILVLSEVSETRSSFLGYQGIR